jgi:CheY-like chemotaxis protein
MDKIMVIENQITQFETISEYLNINYQAVPLSADYLTLIDNVRVWINEQYSPDYRKSAINYINEFIDSEEICLILMDYKLGGAHSCLKGTDLAKKINKKRKKNNISTLPVIFLSKSEHTDKIRVKDFDAYKKKFSNTLWVHKGYFGEEILEKTYFKKYVLDEIDKMLPMDISATAIEILDEFIKRKEPINNLSGGETGNLKKSLNLCKELLTKIQENAVVIDTNAYGKVQDLIRMESELGKKKFDTLIQEILKYKK